MHEYEMIKDMCPDYGTMCDKCNANGHCTVEYTAKRLIDKNWRKIADDEVVIKKCAYEELKKAKQEIVSELLKELNDEGYKIYKQQGNTFDASNFNWLIAHTMQKHDIKSE